MYRILVGLSILCSTSQGSSLHKLSSMSCDHVIGQLRQQHYDSHAAVASSKYKLPDIGRYDAQYDMLEACMTSSASCNGLALRACHPHLLGCSHACTFWLRQAYTSHVAS